LQALVVASEVYPLVKTGGLADVAGALPAALARRGVQVRTLVPGYPAVLEKLERGDPVHAFPDLFGGEARLLAGVAGGLDLFVLDALHLFGRSGGPYADSSGVDWPDNAERFAALGRAAAAIGGGAVPGFGPDVVHAHDWQAGLAPAYLHFSGGQRPATVMTIHNLAFQGRFPAELFGRLGLPPAAWSIDGVEYYGGVGYLKAGLQCADRITTVSPTYAAEIATPEGGMGLDGLLRARSAVVSGILNGIDDAVWDPSGDPHLAARFDVDTLDRRRENKRALQERFTLDLREDALLLGVISRLSWQKGLDLLLAALPDLIARDCQLVVLGSGEAGLEHDFRAASFAWSGRVGVFIGYDEALAHLIQGGADAFLVPSRFEPCGLTQLCALRYGAAPIVARVGGLNDTIIDANEMALAAGVATGFQFAPPSREALEKAIARAAALWRDRPAWRRMQENGMRAEVGWGRPAARYAELYHGAVAARSLGMAVEHAHG
jgi:starch synthase